jgi:hypothetical protein
MRVVPSPKTLASRYLAQQSHRAACGPGGLRRPLKNRSGHGSIPRVRVLTSLHHAPKGPKQVSPGQSEAAQPLSPPGLTVPPKSLRPERARQARDVVRIKRHRSQRRAPLPSIRSHPFLTEFVSFPFRGLCSPFQGWRILVLDVFVLVLGSCLPRCASRLRRGALPWATCGLPLRGERQIAAPHRDSPSGKPGPSHSSPARQSRRPPPHQPSRRKRPVPYQPAGAAGFPISRPAQAAGSSSAEPQAAGSLSAEPRERPVPHQPSRASGRF